MSPESKHSAGPGFVLDETRPEPSHRHGENCGCVECRPKAKTEEPSHICMSCVYGRIPGHCLSYHMGVKPPITNCLQFLRASDDADQAEHQFSLMNMADICATSQQQTSLIQALLGEIRELRATVEFQAARIIKEVNRH